MSRETDTEVYGLPVHEKKGLGIIGNVALTMALIGLCGSALKVANDVIDHARPDASFPPHIIYKEEGEYLPYSEQLRLIDEVNAFNKHKPDGCEPITAQRPITFEISHLPDAGGRWNGETAILEGYSGMLDHDKPVQFSGLHEIIHANCQPEYQPILFWKELDGYTISYISGLTFLYYAEEPVVFEYEDGSILTIEPGHFAVTSLAEQATYRVTEEIIADAGMAAPYHLRMDTVFDYYAKELGITPDEFRRRLVDAQSHPDGFRRFAETFDDPDIYQKLIRAAVKHDRHHVWGTVTGE